MAIDRWYCSATLSHWRHSFFCISSRSVISRCESVSETDIPIFPLHRPLLMCLRILLTVENDVPHCEHWVFIAPFNWGVNNRKHLFIYPLSRTFFTTLIDSWLSRVWYGNKFCCLRRNKCHVSNDLEFLSPLIISVTRDRWRTGDKIADCITSLPVL